MRPIPLALRRKLEKEPRMGKCIACGSTKEIEWHHPLKYRGRQINEIYSIVALCKPCHRGNNGTIDRYASVISELVAITLGLTHLQENYPKASPPWLQRKHYLEKAITRL